MSLTDEDIKGGEEVVVTEERAEDQRSIKEILIELIAKTEEMTKTYNRAIKQLEQVYKQIDEKENVYVNISGRKRKFMEFIEECASNSIKEVSVGKLPSFGELILNGLGSKI